MHLHRYAIALGSNRPHGRHGAPQAVIGAALVVLGDAGVGLLATSSIIATAPIGPASRRFANAAAIVETGLEPPALLKLLKRIESDFGRRRGRRWGDRVVDLDILLWSGGRWIQPAVRDALIIPHRHIYCRDFVLRPLREIVATWPDRRAAAAVRHAYARLLRPKPVDRAARGQ